MGDSRISLNEKSKIQPAPKIRGRLSAFVLLDKEELVCYDDAVILTLSENAA